MRAAIEETNVNGGADKLIFDTWFSSIPLTLGQLQINNDAPATDDLIIEGPGASKLTISGNNASRVFAIDSGAGAAINRITISEGRSNGGGIYNDQGTVTLTNSTVSGNSANRGGGIFNLGTLTLTSTTVGDNTSFTNPGQTNGAAGIYNEEGAVTLTNTIVANDGVGENCFNPVHVQTSG